MAQLIKAVIDTQKNSYRSIGQVNAADDLELELEVKMNGQPIEFINPECELLIKKSDNNKVRQTKDIIYKDGKFKIKVDEQGVTYPGIVTCQLLTREDGRVSTCLFYFMVATSLDGEILKSISKVEVLEQLEEYIVTAFANLKDFEEKVLSSDETIRKLNYDMNESEKIRDTAELQRQETFKSLKENMNEAITNLESSINLSNMNEKERSEVFNSLKSNLESIKQDLINLNASVESEEEKRVQAEINRVNKALEIIEKLESTNNSVATAEAERVSEFNKIKTENNTLKEALTTINNTANSNEEVRKENETSRVEAEKARVNEFNTMKLENETFKQEINEQFEDIINKNNTFKKEMNTDFGNAKTGYDGKEYLNVVDRLNGDFDNVHQRINDSSYLAYEGTNITADNSYYGYVKEMSVKGRTLQNLITKYGGSTANYEISNGLITVDASIGEGYRWYSPLNNGMIKPNTKYTIILDIIENTLNGRELEINYSRVDGNISGNCIADSIFLPLGSMGKIIKVVMSKEDVTNQKYIISPRLRSEQTSGILKFYMTVLEGDYTNTPLEELPFGEGIYSVGESEDNLIKVKSCETIDLNDVKIQVSEGTSITSYEPYQESIQELKLNEPLRSLPNGVCDEITEDGTEIRRVGKIVFNGSENWRNGVGTNESFIDVRLALNQLVGKNNRNGLCDTLPYASYIDAWICTKEGISVYNHATVTEVIASIPKTKVIDLQSWKDWLSQNPTTVYYELNEPIIKKHNKNMNLKTFEGTTHITSDNYLLPTISCKVPSNVQATIMNLKEENEFLNNAVSLMSLENEEVKLVNETQDVLINTTMLATDEMYMMLEPLLSEVAQTLSLEREVSKMVDLYVAMVMRGLKTIEQVPARYREEVREILAQLEK